MKAFYYSQILAIAGMPQMRPPLIDLGHLVTKQSSLMIVGDVIQVIILMIFNQFLCLMITIGHQFIIHSDTHNVNYFVLSEFDDIVNRFVKYFVSFFEYFHGFFGQHKYNINT